MIHKSRGFNVRDIESAEELAKKLTSMTWCGCDGFRHKGILFLNDSFSPDGAQEYAAIRESDGMQFESLTFSWMDEAKALESIQRNTDAAYVEERIKSGSFVNKVDMAKLVRPHKECHLCL